VPANFYTDVIQADPRFHSPEVCRDLDLLEPVFRGAVEAVISEAAALIPPVILRVSETYRSPARQQALFAKGLTQLKDLGVHSFGLACDFFKLVDGKASWEGDWSFLRDLAVKHGLISGYDWGQPQAKHTFTDNDHVQRISVADQPKLFAGDWYPDESYRPNQQSVT
jgi:hypothetical protein